MWHLTCIREQLKMNPMTEETFSQILLLKESLALILVSDSAHFSLVWASANITQQWRAISCETMFIYSWSAAIYSIYFITKSNSYSPKISRCRSIYFLTSCKNCGSLALAMVCSVALINLASEFVPKRTAGLKVVALKMPNSYTYKFNEIKV